ncbi:MAG: uncharacterized membrane protein (DUF373 family) [Flavobacteriales bacterium]
MYISFYQYLQFFLSYLIITDLVYIFYSEVKQFSFIDKKSIALSGVPIFFNILIALEILETFNEPHKNILSRIKIILLVALTAVVRKIITMDIKHIEYLLIISISAVVISICSGYYFLSKKQNTA